MSTRRKIQEKDWQIYMQCTKCGNFKLATLEFWARNSWCFLGLRSICKECDKKIRETKEYKEYHKAYRNTEKQKARVKEYKKRTADTKVWENRRNYSRNRAKEYRKKNKEKIRERNNARREKNNIEKRARNRAKKLELIWKSCPICGRQGKITLHHPDYNKRYEVILCCDCCHKRIHAWRDVQWELINIKEIIKEKNYFNKTNNHAKKIFDKAEE